MTRYLEICGRQVGPERPVYVVAELSANHNQDFEQAVQIIQAAKRAGADAVKLQTYTPDTMTLRSDREQFRIGRHAMGRSSALRSLWRGMHTLGLAT